MEWRRLGGHSKVEGRESTDTTRWKGGRVEGRKGGRWRSGDQLRTAGV